MSREIREIAGEIVIRWRKIDPAARDCVMAMGKLISMDQLISMEDLYGADSASDIVRRFLINANGWRGAAAVRVKRELHEMLRVYERECLSKMRK
jgi:hypothetical protein